MSIRYLLGVFILSSFTATCQVNEQEVARILKALSSDEMQGRSLGSEGMVKTTSFIANEFESIGLTTFKNEKTFLQNFDMQSISVSVDEVLINGVTIKEDNYFFKLSDNEISWTSDNEIELIFINDSDNFREKAGTALSSKSNTLVIISSDHKSMFSRYQSYFSRSTMSFGNKVAEGENIGFVLVDAEELNTLTIKAKKDIETTKLTNVVGVIEGSRSDEIVLFSAHHDHLGIKTKADGDSIYNGANDDASGVTAVIELARYFKSKGKPTRTLVFTTFTAEEVGGYGSKYFSQQLNPDNIVAMLNIEMIGKESKEGINSAWMSGWYKSNLGEILQENLEKVDFKFFADPYPEQDLFYRSDNATLARLGVPAHSISTTQIDIDTDYHQPSDEFETLDVTNITNTIKAIAVGSQGIVDGTQTPSRVDPSEVRD